MKIELNVKKKFDVKYLAVEANVRYWEDTTVDGQEDEIGCLIPCREGDAWKPVIDIETGIIINWIQGIKADVHYKVCDAGEYWLLDKNKEKIVKSLGYYVPSTLSIDDNEYGDYIIMKIGKDGKINNFKLILEDFVRGLRVMRKERYEAIKNNNLNINNKEDE